MRIVRRSYPYFLVIFILTMTILFVPFSQSSAATQRTLSWSVVDTPSDGSNGMIICTCGINDLAIGPDNRTFYAVSTDNSSATVSNLFKSTDAGYSWLPNTGTSLTNAGALFPVWNIAVAPDDAKFIIAVTDGTGTPADGPRMAYYSTDGGANWYNTGLTLNPNEYISCLDIARYDSADQLRDIAIGTRSTTPPGQGRLLTRPYGTTFSGAWLAQDPGTWTAVTSVKFSPGYNPDQTMVVTSFNGGGAALHLGKHDTVGNTTQWDGTAGYAGYPVPLGNTLIPPIVYSASNIYRTGIELPSDYVGTDLSLRGCFVNADNITHSHVFYVSNTPTVFDITPTGIPRIYSIAYSGTNATGILLAGEATANSARALANVWQSSNPQATCAGCVTWLKSDTLKSATGGGGTGRANVLLKWNSDGSTAYCGTSSENSTTGGTGVLPGQWPFSRLTKSASDESAFQYSKDFGFAWNQIGIINTVLSQLSDVAAVEIHEGSNVAGHNTLYLASLNTTGAIPDIDSVWRSTSDPMGRYWERIFTLPSSDTGTILRLAPRDTASTAISQVVVFADLGTENITYSANTGDTWMNVLAATLVKDISLLDDSTMYVLADYYVRKIALSGTAWQTVKKIDTELVAPAHTICNPVNKNGDKEYIFVGTEGNTDTSVAWVDFSVMIPRFSVLKELPEQGNVHVITDDLFEIHKNIFVGINDVITNADGIIYRWTMDSSVNWDPLDPPDRGFYGICMLNNVLYGAWNTDIDPPINSSGADRTLEARIKVPPAPEWDQLIDGLPQPGSPNQVEFTREPTSLHISSNAYNTLWAIDDTPYNFTTKQGCLWQFIDSVAKLGPWPTSPAPGSLIGADPSTGRSQQIDFKWRPLRDIYSYDLLIAKDVNFTLPLTQQLQMTPVDDVTGSWIVTPADQIDPSCWIAPGQLEVGRSYYWRVRGARSWQGSPIHSPWSATLFFSVRPGFMVTSEYTGPTLLTPIDGVCSNCAPPIRFSWSPIKNAGMYQFTLARDAQLTDVIVQETTTTTAFELKSRLPLSTPYYWQVKAVAPVVSDPSPVGTFTLVDNITQSQKQPAVKQQAGAVPAASDFWIWIIIVIVVVLLLLINAFVFISRRRNQ
ncbi:MAG: hypothetical protein JW901_03640 [Dehalococcoidia bacterium]|nr:hypothetical protein [Dehalococcoidia bacterium]